MFIKNWLQSLFSKWNQPNLKRNSNMPPQIFDQELRGYQPRLANEKGQYHLFISELGLSVSSNTIDEAYKALKDQLDTIIGSFEETETPFSLPPPVRFSGQRSPVMESVPIQGNPKRKWITVGIIIVLVIGSSFWAERRARSFIKSVATDASQYASYIPSKIYSKIAETHYSLLWEALVQKIHSVADPKYDPSPEQVEELVKSIRILVDRAKPITDELSALLVEGAATAPSQINVAEAAFGGNCSTDKNMTLRAVARICDGKTQCQFQPLETLADMVDPNCQEQIFVSWRCFPSEELHNSITLLDERTGSYSVYLNCATP